MIDRERYPFVRCRSCSWVHVGVPAPQPAGSQCYRCKGESFEVIDREEFRRSVPRGVTLQGLRWPLSSFKTSRLSA
jgi:hypothetical protein